MFAFPRSAARRLRLLARKSVVGRPRGPAPPVGVSPDRGGITMAVASADVTVAQHLPGAATLTTPFQLPMDALECVEGAGDTAVQCAASGSDHVTLNWTDRGLPRSQRFSVPKSPPLVLPSLPKTLIPVPVELLQALHEAGRCTAREANRYALQRVQIRGRAGEVIGTDSYFVYRREGFHFPFAQDLLVPAVPLFGLDEWSQASSIRVGRTDQHLVVVADAVTVFLTVDTVGRYPDVASVVPKGPATATLTLDPEDALFLLDALPTLPGNDEQHQSVTLDLSPGAAGVIRAKAGKAKSVVEVHLPRSTVKSGPLRIALDRRYLIRMLTLGCCKLRAYSDHRPLVATAPSITTVLMPVDADLIVPPSPHTQVLTPDVPTQLSPARSTPMKTPEPTTNNHDGEALDPIAEADALRSALGEAHHRLSRLLAALRLKKKEQKALSQVWSSLKSLNLGARND